MKITVVGAGAVGATTADNIIRRELAEELVLLDIKEGVSEGKSLDMYQTAALLGFNTKPIGSTNDYRWSNFVYRSRSWKSVSWINWKNQ